MAPSLPRIIIYALLFIHVTGLGELHFIRTTLSDKDGASSSGTITMTLWFKNTVYQYSFTNPAASEIFESYVQQSPMLTTISSSHCVNLEEVKVMIEIDDTTDAAMIDKISIHTVSGIWFGIDQICRVRIDNEPDHFDPYKQIVYFDLTRPNQY
eukprot:17949_1